MKTRILVLLISIISFSAYSQKIDQDDLPEAIIKGFLDEYPDSKAKNWEKAGDIYVATTKIDGQASLVEINSDGKWIATKYLIGERELPSNIINYIYEKNENSVIEFSAYVENNKEESYYFTEVKNEGLNQPVTELFFDINGELLKRKSDGSFEKRVDKEIIKEEIAEVEKEEKETQSKIGCC